MLLTAIYIRVSTLEQAQEGFSLKAQKEKLVKYAELNEWLIVDFYIDDGLSGKSIKERPQVKRLIKDIETGIVNNVLVYKLDRLTRSVADLIVLINLFETYNCAFNSQTEKIDTSNAVGRMFVKILGIFAEFERENLAERIAFGYEQKTREGNYTNPNGVYGYDYLIGGKLEVNKREEQLVNQIYNLYLKGNSMVSISKYLNKNHIPTKRGGKWQASTIKSILTNPLYIGKVRYGVRHPNELKKFITQGKDIKPIIELNLWGAVQALLKKRQQNNKKQALKAYFSCCLKCAYCNSSYEGCYQKQKGKQYISYVCKGRKQGICKSIGFSQTKMDQAFWQYLNQNHQNLVLNNLKWGYLTNQEKKVFLERFFKVIMVKKIKDKVIISKIEFSN